MSSTYTHGVYKLGGVTIDVGAGREFSTIVITYPTDTVPYLTAVLTRGDATTVTITTSEWTIVKAG